MYEIHLIIFSSLADECHSCKELIKSDTILAGPHHFHEHCFTCAHCNMRLGDNFYSINSENYCLQHKDVRNITLTKPFKIFINRFH